MILVCGYNELCPCKTVNLIYKCCVCSDCSTEAVPSSLSFFSGLPTLWDTNSIEITPINNPTMASKCWSHISHFESKAKNKVSKGNMLKSEMGWKLGLLCQLAKLWMQRKSSWRKLKVPLQWTHNKKAKRLVADWEKVLLVWIKDQTSHNIPLSQSLIQSKALTLF